MKFTSYLGKKLRERTEVKLEWVLQTYAQPDARAVQLDRRIRLWKYIPEMKHYLRVILLPDGETILNAFFDRSFKP